MVMVGSLVRFHRFLGTVHLVEKIPSRFFIALEDVESQHTGLAQGLPVVLERGTFELMNEW